MIPQFNHWRKLSGIQVTLPCNYGNFEPPNFPGPAKLGEGSHIENIFEIKFWKIWEMKATNQLKKIKSTLVILSALSVLLVGFDVLEFSVEWMQVIIWKNFFNFIFCRFISDMFESFWRLTNYKLIQERSVGRNSILENFSRIRSWIFWEIWQKSYSSHQTSRYNLP